MKNAPRVPAVTSLPQSPRDEADHRVRRYAIMMAIRIVCFALMALVQPYGWYTWVFGLAAAVLPYIAVVIANAGSDSEETTVESPAREITAPAEATEETAEESPHVLRIHESGRELS